MNEKIVRASEIIQREAAGFINRESNRSSLITVTNVDLAPDLSKATILVSIYPEEKTKGALAFLMRKRDDVRVHLKEHSKLRRIPFISFAVDEGEKNRQRIDELLGKS